MTDQHAGLPFKWGPVSNGEFVPPPMSPVVREAQRRALRQADENARRLGMSRRRFLSTLSGAAVCLVSLNACASDEKRATSGTTSAPGGSFDVSTTSTMDPDAAAEELAGEEFIMDVQTHFIDTDLSVPLAPGDSWFGQQFPFASCEAGVDAADGRACFARDSYLDELFLKSDTTLAVLSALPIPGNANPLSAEVMEETRRIVLALCPEQRVLMHGGAFPHVGDLGASLEAMTEARENFDIAAWKIYTMIPRTSAFYFDDHDPTKPQIGQAFIDHVREIGPPIICTHKGLKDIVFSDEELSAPTDIGPAAAGNPDISFVVYHSGFELGHSEGEYTEETADQGTNRLVKSLLDAGVEPNSNVYAELGGTWQLVMRDPERAAHVIGKLLKYVGEDRVVWGTDSIWFGSPQDQIQAMRTFQISEEFQERYGYPALTDEIKAKIFGLTSASLYGIEPTAIECEFTRDDLQAAREEVAAPPRTYGPQTATEVAMVLRSHGAM
jgi:hypothetical protein